MSGNRGMGQSMAVLRSRGTDPPPWVGELVRDRGQAFVLAEARVPGARRLGDVELQAQTAEAYARIARQLGDNHPVRMWNRVPGLLSPARGDLNRYMVFNAGRHAALLRWFGSEAAVAQCAPAASGVGCEGDDLVIHALGARRPGRSVGNPRQVEPMSYSRRYGPKPPCFARATRLADLAWMLVGGTAAVRGEESVCADDLPGQLEETLTNLAALVGEGDDAAPLARYRELRVYYPRPGDEELILRRVEEAFGQVRRVEMVRAELCRAELLVEIEGVAWLGAEEGHEHGPV